MSSCKYFVTFASSHYYKTLERLKNEAIDSRFFDSVNVYNENDFPSDYWLKYHLLYENNNKFGFWIWKPYWINHVLETIDEGDYLIYLDAGCEINKSGKKKLEQYLQLSKESKSGIVAFSTGTIERQFTKGDTLDFFQVRDRADITDSPQIMATLVIICKKSQSIDLVHKWVEITHGHFNLIDYSPSVSPDLAGFVQNRCDQSIFSLLCKTIGGVKILPSSDVQAWPDTNRNWRKLKNNPFLTVRNRKGGKRVQHSKYTTMMLNYWWDLQNMCDFIKTECVNLLTKLK